MYSVTLVREAESKLPFYRPRLESKSADLAGHDEGGEAHAEGEGKHRVQLVVLHRLDYRARLQAY